VVDDEHLFEHACQKKDVKLKTVIERQSDMQLQVAANGRDADEHAASDELAAEFKSVVIEVEDEAVRDPMRVWESSVYCTPEGCRFPAAQYGAEERPLFCARVEKRNQDGKMQVCGGGLD
jgi:hypothetical protein